jgi:hypothetical protein
MHAKTIEHFDATERGGVKEELWHGISIDMAEDELIPRRNTTGIDESPFPHDVSDTQGVGSWLKIWKRCLYLTSGVSE